METIVSEAGFDVPVIYQNHDVLVINKPAGLIMHAKNNSDKTVSVQSIFASRIDGGEKGREGIVHRLDKYTSGVVILAKNQFSLEFLQRQFARRKVTKEYTALVWGHLKRQYARIELPIRRSLKSPAMMSIHSSGKESVSEYRAVEQFKDFSLLNITLHTGRTHQIRVQFAHLGHPVVGDALYGNKPMSSGLDRQFLHAKKLCLQLPGQTQTDCFEAPLPDDLNGFLEQIDD